MDIVDNINNVPDTQESVWAAFRESDRLRKESEARFEREMEKSRADFEFRMKKLDEQIGGISKSQGLIAEEFFINSLYKDDKHFFGELFDKCIYNYKYHNKRTHKKGEFDIILINGKSVAIVETKFRARKKDIQKLIDIIPDFKEEFPQYQSHQIYLGLAALAFDEKVAEESINNGIAVFKQVGETVEIYDENLKNF